MPKANECGVNRFTDICIYAYFAGPLNAIKETAVCSISISSYINELKI